MIHFHNLEDKPPSGREGDHPKDGGRSQRAAPHPPLTGHLPQRGRLIRALEMQNIKSFSVIGAQESAKSSKASEAGALWARFRKSSREFHHGKVKACRDAKGAEQESRGRRGGMCPPIRPLGPAQRVPAGETRDFLKRTKLLCASICTDRFFKQERAALGPRGLWGISISPLCPLGSPAPP